MKRPKIRFSWTWRKKGGVPALNFCINCRDVRYGKMRDVVNILSFLPIGCSWQSAQINRYSDSIKTWNGHPIDKLQYRWGYPQQLFIAPNGNKVYVYSREAIHTSPTWITPIGNYKIFGGKTTTHYCNTYFEVNNNETIIKSSYEGNACRWHLSMFF